MSHIRLTQIDGKLPNLALMRLAHWHRQRGDNIHFTRSVLRELFEPAYERCLLYTSPSPRDRTRSRMPSSA